MDLSSPITGAAMPDLTTPTFTIAADTPADSNQKAYIVTALGGTQSNVTPHTVGKPFQIVIQRPKNVKLPTPSVLEGVGFQSSNPVNEHKVFTRKSVAVNNLGGYGRILIETRFVIPVGAIEQAPETVQSALSAHIGALTQDPDDFYDIVKTGSL